MKTEYSDLLDKEVELEYNGRFNKCYVNGCDYNVGISISETKGGKDYKVCIWNPKVFKRRFPNGTVSISGNNYRKMFQFMVKKIQEGRLSIADKEELYEKCKVTKFSQTAKYCPFNA